MISHAKISRHRRMFKTLTSLSTEGFKQILPSFEEAWEADLDRRDAGRLRLRGSADRLVFILVYFRLYSIQAVQGLLFGMSQPQANEWVHRLTPFLNAALGHQQQPQPASPATSRRRGPPCPVHTSVPDAGRTRVPETFPCSPGAVSNPRFPTSGCKPAGLHFLEGAVALEFFSLF